MLRLTDYKTVEEEIRDLRLSQEEEVFQLRNMVKYGNPVLNLIFVDSYFFPRHARWTLIFMNTCLILVICAFV